MTRPWRAGLLLVALAAIAAGACGDGDRVRELEADLAGVRQQVHVAERDARAAEGATELFRADADDLSREIGALEADLAEREGEVEALRQEFDRATAALGTARARAEVLAALPDPPPLPPLPTAAPVEAAPDSPPAEAEQETEAAAEQYASEETLAALTMDVADLGADAVVLEERYAIAEEGGLAEFLRRFEGAAIGPGESRPRGLGLSTSAYLDAARAQAVVASARPWLEENGQAFFELTLATALGPDAGEVTLVEAGEIPFQAGDVSLVWTMTGESAEGPVSALFGFVVVGRLAGSASVVAMDGEVALGDALSLLGAIASRLRDAPVELREGVAP